MHKFAAYSIPWILLLLPSLVLAVPSTIVEQVADIRPGPSSSAPDDLASYDGEIFFRATQDATGRELWGFGKDGAYLVADIRAGTPSSYPGEFTVFQNDLYFRGSKGTANDFEIWRYDGVVAELAVPVNTGVDPNYVSDFAVLDNNLYFQARDPVHGIELWRFDGSSASLVEDINPEPTDDFFVSIGSSWPAHLSTFDGSLYFQAIGSSNNLSEPWRFDGNRAVQVADINAGPGGSTSNGSGFEFTVFDDKLYFKADDGIHGLELWSFDGTTAQMVADVANGAVSSNPQFLTVVGDKLLFSAFDELRGVELWEFDGSTVSIAADINFGPSSSNPSDLENFNGTLYFSAIDSTVPGLQGDEMPALDGKGVELWMFDGSAASLVADIYPGSSSSSPSSLLATSEALYFAARNEETGTELWRLTFVPEPSSGVTVLSLLGCLAYRFLYGRVGRLTNR